MFLRCHGFITKLRHLPPYQTAPVRLVAGGCPYRRIHLRSQPDFPILIAMDNLRVGAALALSLAVLCSGERSDVMARAAATGALTGYVHVVSHPARRLAT